MSQILTFPFDRRMQERVVSRQLLNRLCGSLDIMWRDCWAELGEHGEVVVLRRQHCIGIWRCGVTLTYHPVAGGDATLEAANVNDAYWMTMALIVEQRDQSQCAWLEGAAHPEEIIAGLSVS